MHENVKYFYRIPTLLYIRAGFYDHSSGSIERLFLFNCVYGLSYIEERAGVRLFICLFLLGLYRHTDISVSQSQKLFELFVGERFGIKGILSRDDYFLRVLKIKSVLYVER